MAILQLANLQKAFGALVVTDGFSLDVEPGEIVGILGPNGAGKTTLFNLVTGTVKPDAGEVIFDEEDISTIDAAGRCQRGISRSFQVPHPFVGMSVFENVLVGAMFGRHGADPEGHALRVLELTGLQEKSNQLAGSLSLLERKRLEMARALATEPKLLLLDEIAGGLTDSECKSLLDAIRDVHASGVTIIWIEHVVHALLSVATRLVVVDFGRTIADDSPDKVMKDEQVKSIYLGVDEHA